MEFLKILPLVLLIPARLFGQDYSYQPGERVDYTINYGPVQAGSGYLELKRDTFKGREVWHSTLLGKTTGMAPCSTRLIR